MTAQQNHTPTAAEIELDLAARRARLAGTIDELMERVTPKQIARHSAQGVKDKLDDAVRTADGGLRVERIAVLAVAGVVVVAVAVLARRRRL